MIKKQFISILLVFLFLTANGNTHQSIVDTCFSPSDNCTQKITSIVQSCKKRIYVHSYSFISHTLSQALIDAFKRGIDVKVYIDKGRAKEPHSRVKDLQTIGIPVIIQKSNYLAHNKIMVVDDDTVITGSFNWTENAKKNEENIVIIKSSEVVKKYIRNWECIVK